jgi:hypothetical protein
VGRKDPEASVRGMPRGTANSKLRKKILFELLRKAGANKCRHCGLDIVLSEDLAIEHLQDWRNDPDLFWVLNNIAFSHLNCSSGAARQEGKSMIADIKIVSEDGEQLPTFYYEGKIYIAGRRDERYSIHIQNKISERIEVVISVDGRDAISGEVGNAHRTGYAIPAYGTAVIQGFRQSNDKVAAFRFSEKSESYSAKLGTPQNVGVIGVAVYREKQEPWYWPVVIPPIVLGTPPPCQPPWPCRPGVPYTTYYSANISSCAKGFSAREEQTGGSVLRSDAIRGISDWDGRLGVPAMATPNSRTYSCNTVNTGPNPETCAPCAGPAAAAAAGDVDADDELCFNEERSYEPARRRQRQTLGTEYGESIRDRVSSTRFVRASSEPSEVWQVFYDTMSALRKKGIPTHKWRRQDRVTPDPFPANPYIAPGYAKPPPR